MEKLADSPAFKALQNIVLEGFDPVSAGGFTQVPNILLNETELSFAAKVAYAKLLSYAWNNNLVFPGLQTMAKQLGCAISTVSEAVTELRRAGWVDVVRRGQGKTNVYKLRYVVAKK